MSHSGRLAGMTVDLAIGWRKVMIPQVRDYKQNLLGNQIALVEYRIQAVLG